MDNLENMRRFFLVYPRPLISETLSRKSGSGLPAEKSETMSRNFSLSELAQVFTLPWSAYVRLLSIKDAYARQFYETEALRGGWSVRQLDRQIGSQFYERTALSRDKAAMLTKGAKPKWEDAWCPHPARPRYGVLGGYAPAQAVTGFTRQRSRFRGSLLVVCAADRFGANFVKLATGSSWPVGDAGGCRIRRSMQGAYRSKSAR